MAAIRSEAPGVFKKILELRGYKVVAEDVYNWIMAANDDDVPITVPKLGDVVDLGVLMHILDKAQIDNRTYFLLLSQAVQAVEDEPQPPN